MTTPPEPDDEHPAEKVGRIAGGLLMVILGIAIGLGGLGVWIVGPFIPVISDLAIELGDLWMYVAIVGLIIFIFGAEFMRRSRKQRLAADKAQAEAMQAQIAADRAAGGDSPDAPPLAPGVETKL